MDVTEAMRLAHCDDYTPTPCEQAAVSFVLAEEVKRLLAIEAAANDVLALARESITPLVRDGIHAFTTKSMADQFSAAWRDLRKAVRQ